MKTIIPDKERYSLHKKVKRAFKVNARDKYITIPRDIAKTIQHHELYPYIERLRSAGYHIQLSILKSNK